MEKEDKILTDKEINKSLKFSYVKNSAFDKQGNLEKKKLSKGLTVNEATLNEILKKQSELDGLISKLKDLDINTSYSNTIESNSNNAKKSKLPKRKSSGRLKLRRFKTSNDGLMDKISNVANLNINININKTPQKKLSPNIIIVGNQMDDKKKSDSSVHDEQPNKDNLVMNENIQVIKKSERMWKLSKNAIKMVKGFTNHDVKKIEYENELDNDIEIYKRNKAPPKKSNKSGPSLVKFMNKSEMEKELNRLHLKEAAYEIITEGCKDFKRELDEVFNKNQERFMYDPQHPNFLFNQILPDTKKTLLYTACQEGNYNIVDYFLTKKLNPSIKSKVNENELETCLDVAARWNYTDIVKLLLEKGNISGEDVKETLRNKHLKKPVIKLLTEFLSIKEGKKKTGCSGCACF